MLLLERTISRIVTRVLLIHSISSSCREPREVGLTLWEEGSYRPTMEEQVDQEKGSCLCRDVESLQEFTLNLSKQPRARRPTVYFIFSNT